MSKRLKRRSKKAVYSTGLKRSGDPTDFFECPYCNEIFRYEYDDFSDQQNKQYAYANFKRHLKACSRESKGKNKNEHKHLFFNI